MWKDLADRYFQPNRMRSRFDDQIEESIDGSESQKIHFKRFLSKKKRTSMVRLLILFAAVLWAYYYFTSVN